MMMQMVGAFAEFERAMLKERRPGWTQPAKRGASVDAVRSPRPNSRLNPEDGFKGRQDRRRRRTAV